MRRTLVTFVLILIISTLAFYLMNINSSLDSTMIITLLVILVIQTSLILAIQLNKVKK